MPCVIYLWRNNVAHNTTEVYMNNSYIVTVIDNETGAAQVHGAWEIEGCDCDADLYAHAAKTISNVVRFLGTANVTIHVDLCEA